MLLEGYCSTVNFGDGLGRALKPVIGHDAIRLVDPNEVPLLYDHDPKKPLGKVLHLSRRDGGLWCVVAVNTSFGTGYRLQNENPSRLAFSVGIKEIHDAYYFANRWRVASDAALAEISVVVEPANPQCKARIICPDEYEENYCRTDGLPARSDHSALPGRLRGSARRDWAAA